MRVEPLTLLVGFSMSQTLCLILHQNHPNPGHVEHISELDMKRLLPVRRRRSAGSGDSPDSRSPSRNRPSSFRLPNPFRPQQRTTRPPTPLHERPPAVSEPASNSGHNVGGEAGNRQKVDVWQKAFEKLEPRERELLEPKESGEGNVKPSIHVILDSVIQRAEKFTEGDQQGAIENSCSDESTTSTPIRDAVRITAECALRVKSVVDTVVKFDKSGYAALAWSIVSFGLELVEKDRERQEDVLKASAFLAEILERYSLVDEMYAVPDPGLNHFREEQLVFVYAAILRYSAHVLQAKKENPIQRVKQAFLTLTSGLLQELRGRIQDADSTAEKRLRIVEFLATTKALNEITDKVDSIDNKLDKGACGLEYSASKNREAIIDALKPHFPNARADDIKDAQTTTFEWILCESNQAIAMSSGCIDATSFPEWLKSGYGVFHISGKPGSGKSTLMKFLATHTKVHDYLATWAASDNKELILSEFYVWKLGSDDQKSMRGLLRGLLYNIVRHHPSIVETIFPGHWKPDQYANTVAVGPPSITDRDVDTAFRRLFEHPDIAQRFRLCLFIDGLDELDDKDVSHWKLAETLRKWTEGPPTNSAVTSTEVKICVSSREEEPIMKELQSSQQIALHQLTTGDVSTLVRDRLGANKYFQQLDRNDHDGCEDLILSIITGAEGVFLWVTLLLTRIEDNLPSSGTSVATLKHILRSTPKELEAFLQQILDSIQEHHRVGASFILAMALRMTGLHLASSGQFTKAERERYDKQFKDPRFWNPALSVFGLSYVFDALERGDEITSDFDWRIPERVTLAEVESRTCISADRLKTWCQNLMEPMSRSQAMPNTRAHVLLSFDDQYAKFSHRSIPEFLISALRGRVTTLGFDDDDVAAGILAVAQAETLSGHELTMHASIPGDIQPDSRAAGALEEKLATRLRHILGILRLRPISATSPILPMLDKLEEARVQSYIYRPSSWAFRDPADSKVYKPRRRDIGRGRQQCFIYGLEKIFEHPLSLEWDENSTVMTHAAFTELFEYVQWKLTNDPSFAQDLGRLYSALCGVSASILHHGCSQGSTSTLRLLLEAGAPYEVAFGHGFPGWESGKIFSIWSIFDAPWRDTTPGLNWDGSLPNSPWSAALHWYADVVASSLRDKDERRIRRHREKPKLTPDLWASLETWFKFGAKPPVGVVKIMEPLVAGIRYYNPPNASKLLGYLSHDSG